MGAAGGLDANELENKPSFCGTFGVGSLTIRLPPSTFSFYCTICVIV